MTNKKIKPIVIGGFCKSGTTVISKCLAYCLDMDWQNEIREAWHIDKYASSENPQGEIQASIKQNKEDRIIKANVKDKKVIKFPQAIYVPNLIVPKAHLIIVVRHPADTICAYLERKHEFKFLKFPWLEIQTMSKRWNYAYLSLQFVNPTEYCVIKYEDFVTSPEKVINFICLFVGIKQKRRLPNWHTKQVLPYFDFDKKGRPVRGIGRSKLSLTARQIHRVLKNCRLAINLLSVSNPKIAEYLK